MSINWIESSGDHQDGWELEGIIELCLCKGKAEGNGFVQAGGEGSGELPVCSSFMDTQSKSFSGMHCERM